MYILLLMTLQNKSTVYRSNIITLSSSTVIFATSESIIVLLSMLYTFLIQLWVHLRLFSTQMPCNFPSLYFPQFVKPSTHHII